MSDAVTMQSAKSALDAIDKRYAELCQQKQQMEAELSRGSVPLDLRGKWVTRLKSLDHSLPQIRKERHQANEIYETFRRDDWLRKQKWPVDIKRVHLEGENRKLKQELLEAQQRITELERLRDVLIQQTNATPVSMRG